MSRVQKKTPTTTAADAVKDFRVFREWFDERSCGKADCMHATERIELRSNCHPDAPVMVRYSFVLQALTITCAVCGMGVADVVVAARTANGYNKKIGVLPADAMPTPTVVQRMDQRSRKNRVRRK